MNRGFVLAPNWLGDAVMCLPALAALRAARPETTWTVLARPAVAPVFALARLGLEVAPLPGRPHSLRLPPAAGPLAGEVAIIFPNSFHAALLALRTGAHRRIGYARDGRSWLLRPAIALPAPGSLPGHESFYYLELLRRAGLLAALPADSPAALRVPLHPDPAAAARWRADFGHGPVVAIHAGATFGAAKQWLPERYAELAASLAGRGALTVLIGGPTERELAERVRQLSQRPDCVRNAAGQTSLEELAALLGAVNVVVGNDSGPMHLAGAVGTPVVAIFGATNERETYPLTAAGGLRLVKAPGIECSPCKLRECPIDHRCMTRIHVSTVLTAIEETGCFEHRRG